MKVTKKIVLSENDMPTQWYNITADLKNKPLPMLHPGTKQPLKPEEMEGLFAKALAEHDFPTERYTEPPAEVRDLYNI